MTSCSDYYMQLSKYIYTHCLVLRITFNDFLTVISQLNSLNLVLSDELTPIVLEKVMNGILWTTQETQILYEYLSTINSTVLYALVVLFNQLELKYTKTRMSHTCVQLLDIYDKYYNSYNFWYSQFKEFVVSISLLENKDYLEVNIELLESILNVLCDPSEDHASNLDMIHDTQQYTQKIPLDKVYQILDNISKEPIFSIPEHLDLIQTKYYNSTGMLKRIKYSLDLWKE